MGHPAIVHLGLRIRPGRKEPLHRVGMAAAGRHMKRPLTSVGGFIKWIHLGLVQWPGGRATFFWEKFFSSCFFFQRYLICNNKHDTKTYSTWPAYAYFES